jgi:hypothetical protein
MHEIRFSDEICAPIASTQRSQDELSRGLHTVPILLSPAILLYISSFPSCSIGEYGLVCSAVRKVINSAQDSSAAVCTAIDTGTVV